MEVALLIVFAVGVVAYVAFGLRHRLAKSQPETKDCKESDSCGVSCFCGDEAMLRQMSDEIVYFEDEELDAFRGIEADGYDEAQVEAFYEVLSTLRKAEIALWLHSLELRGVALPSQLREEATIMMQ